jgi:hypothetical protein
MMNNSGLVLKVRKEDSNEHVRYPQFRQRQRVKVKAFAGWSLQK